MQHLPILPMQHLKCCMGRIGDALQGTHVVRQVVANWWYGRRAALLEKKSVTKYLEILRIVTLYLDLCVPAPPFPLLSHI